MSDRLASLQRLLRRVGCTPADAIGLAVLSLVSLCALAALWLLARPSPSHLASVDQAAPPSALASDPTGLAVTDGEVIVHVAGAVTTPGVYTLPGGSRVGDAVAAAGGAKPRAVLDALNLARPLTDGEQVVVPDGRDAASQPAGAGHSPAAGAHPDPTPATVNVNQADAATLETLPGIGPVLAERIVQHRDSVGGFESVGELRDVSGIGEKTFQAIAELVSV